MTIYAIAFNSLAALAALSCLLLACLPVRKPCAKQGLSLTRFNRVYSVRCNNAAYARACRNIKLLPTTTIPQLVASKLAIAKHQARLAVITSKLELQGYYDS